MGRERPYLSSTCAGLQQAQQSLHLCSLSAQEAGRHHQLPRERDQSGLHMTLPQGETDTIDSRFTTPQTPMFLYYVSQCLFRNTRNSVWWCRPTVPATGKGAVGVPSPSDLKAGQGKSVRLSQNMRAPLQRKIKQSKHTRRQPSRSHGQSLMTGPRAQLGDRTPGNTGQRLGLNL